MAADDPRDKYREKHRTPNAGVPRAGTQDGIRDRDQAERDRQIDRERSERERDRLARHLYGDREHNQDTPVDMPLPALISRTDTRTKQISSATTSIDHRVGKVETAVAVLGTKMDMVLEESKASREERLAREAAAREDAVRREEREADREKAEREAEEAQRKRQAEADRALLDFRRQKWIDLIKIISPIIAAIGLILAGIAGAFK